jgi:glycosyltransferase involved in cell wall biosynthesis
MKITVILCTRNRGQSLARALESAAALELPDAHQWEVLVVDNNSSDQTRGVVEGFCHRYPLRFRYLFEPQQGKSHALNSGIREAGGDILAFLDDDTTVEPTWLLNLTASLHNGDWAGAGGRTLPQGRFSPPRWLSLKDRYALGPLAIFDRGPDALELKETPFGNNMAYRREVFEKYGGFRTDLGPRPAVRDPQKSEDSEFGQRLLAAGERLRYEPSAVAYHEVPESRLQKKYFLDWWFDKARADVWAYGTPVRTRWRVAGIPLVLFRRLAVWTLGWLVALRPSRRFFCRLKVWLVAGQITESRRQWRDGQTRSSEGVKR